MRDTLLGLVLATAACGASDAPDAASEDASASSPPEATVAESAPVASDPARAEELQQLVAGLRADTVEERLLACTRLRSLETATDDALAALLDCTVHPSRGLREEALRTLLVLFPARGEVHRLVTRGLRDPEDELHAAFVQGAGDVDQPSEELVTALLDLLERAPSGRAPAIVNSLRDLRVTPDRFRDLLVARFESDAWIDRVAAVMGLQSRFPEARAARAVLERAAQDPSVHVRNAVLSDD